MFEIAEQYSFVATHQLNGLAVDHPCAKVHSHRWAMDIVFLSDRLLPTDGPSEVVLLEPLRRYVTKSLDGAHLNDLVIGEATPARIAHHLAAWCYSQLAANVAKALTTVAVSTGLNSRARYLVPKHPPGRRP
jgi:6-pyruvoyltetrahydropterin/6-carboxytetrahydropterin synthase